MLLKFGGDELCWSCWGAGSGPTLVFPGERREREKGRVKNVGHKEGSLVLVYCCYMTR